MQASEAAGGSTSTPVEPQRAREVHKEYSSDSSSDPEPEPNYRAQYIALKKKLKYLIYVRISIIILLHIAIVNRMMTTRMSIKYFFYKIH